MQYGMLSAVSYTHLDVYKRQSLRSANQVCVVKVKCNKRRRAANQSLESVSYTHLFILLSAYPLCAHRFAIAD